MKYDFSKSKKGFSRKLELLAKKYGVSLVILFGSLARGTTNRNSDIDLALSLEKSISETKEWQLFTDFINLLRTDSLDLVILNYASPLLLFQVAKEGIPIFEKKEGSFTRFKIRAFKKYWETEKFRNMRRVYLDKLASGIL